MRPRCPSCRSVAGRRQKFCPRCGSVLPEPGPNLARQAWDSALPTRIWVVLTVGAMIAPGLVGFELQEFKTASTADTVQVDTRAWWVDNDSQRFANAECGPCGGSEDLSGSINVHLVFDVGPEDGNCPTCHGYNVSAVGVEPPFVILNLTPLTFPTLVHQNSTMEWNLTIEVPSQPGSYHLHGFIQGEFY